MEDTGTAAKIDSWIQDWTYETDLVLAHFSGLKVVFYEPVADPIGPSGERSKSLGDFVPGSVLRSRAYFREQGIAQVEHAGSPIRPLRQATLIYRNRRAGAPNAPAMQGV